jgi:hypothetical protein
MQWRANRFEELTTMQIKLASVLVDDQEKALKF